SRCIPKLLSQHYHKDRMSTPVARQSSHSLPTLATRPTSASCSSSAIPSMASNSRAAKKKWHAIKLFQDTEWRDRVAIIQRLAQLLAVCEDTIRDWVDAVRGEKKSELNKQVVAWHDEGRSPDEISQHSVSAVFCASVADSRARSLSKHGYSARLWLRPCG